MSNYSNTFGGAAHDTAEDVIQGTDFDTQFDAIATMSATKANKKVPATTNNIAVLDANGDLADSLETVATMKSYAKRGAIYLDAATTSSTIDFSGTTISRASGTIDLSVFKKGDVITITGTTLNNTSYTLASDASATSMTTTVTTVTESGEIPVFTTEGVVEVLDEDDMASDSATAVPSQQAAKAYSDGKISTDPTGTGTLSTGGTMEVFVSSAITLTGTNQNFTAQAHGLTGAPHEISCYIECTTDDSATTGFVVGDRIPMGGTDSAATNYGIEVWADATNVDGKTLGGIYVWHKSAGTTPTITYANWKLHIVAKYYT